MMKTQTGAQFPRNIGYLRFVVGVVCLALAIISCGENDEDELINTDYLPIKVGNWWKYIEPNDPEEQGLILITGTTKLKDGRTAFIGETDGDRESWYTNHR
jgi:hypothetical protein